MIYFARVVLYVAVIANTIFMTERLFRAVILYRVEQNSEITKCIVSGLNTGNPSSVDVALNNGVLVSLPISSVDAIPFKVGDTLSCHYQQKESIVLIPGVDIQLRMTLGSIVFSVILEFIILLIAVIDGMGIYMNWRRLKGL